MAGTSLSFERSPLAPKMTIAHGAAVRMGPSLLDASCPPASGGAAARSFHWHFVGRRDHARRSSRTTPLPRGARYPSYCRREELQSEARHAPGPSRPGTIACDRLVRPFALPRSAHGEGGCHPVISVTT